MIDSKVSHFEITELLGSGGMGEVYQATDTEALRSHCYGKHSHTTHLEQPTVPAELRASIHDLRCMREETASRQSQATCGFQPKGRLFTICCASKSTPV